MLNRDVCRKCEYSGFNNMIDGWSCTAIIGNSDLSKYWTDEKGEPPKSCPRKFEHAVTAGMRKDAV
jgi:hypothetical protein